jgi:hypothetical protein
MNEIKKKHKLRVLRLNTEYWALFQAQPTERDKIIKSAILLEFDLIIYKKKILWSKI